MINSVDLYYLIIICLAEIESNLRLQVVSIFVYKTATINLIAMVKFFYIIYKAVLLSLFINKYYDGGLLELVSTYFGIVKINSCNMFYLHCLV